MISLVRYSAALTFRAQRWLPPAGLYLVVVVAVTASGGSALPGFALTAAALFPVTAWLVRVVGTTEDPVLSQVTTVNAGSHWRPRVATALTAAGAAGVLGLLAVGFTIASGHASATGTTIGAGLVAEALAVVAGTALGSLVTPPVISRPGWAVSVVVLVTLAELIVPSCPPVRGLLQAFNASHRRLSTDLPTITVETVPVAVILLALSVRYARRRV